MAGHDDARSLHDAVPVSPPCRLVAISLDRAGATSSVIARIGEAVGLDDISTSTRGRRIYVRMPVTYGTAPSERVLLARLRNADRLIETISAGVVAGRLSDASDESDVRAELDELLDWMAAAGRRGVVGATGLRSAFVLDRLRGTTSGRSDLLRGHVQSLERIDATRRTDYVVTLTAYFEHCGDIARAAAALFMHPNTLRYRIRRMHELVGLDLDDPVDRFVTEFQLRVLRAGGVPDPDVVPDENRRGIVR